MGKTLIAGNWKMNLDADKSRQLAEAVDEAAGKATERVETVLFPGFLSVPAVAETVKQAGIGVQNIYFADEGAFTGEVSASQAKEFAGYALVGHSERRHNFGETNESVARKAAACVRNGLMPIICVGETQHEREQNETKQVINDQLSTGLTMLTAGEMEHIAIAYEPVWAIGSGDNASAGDVSEAAMAIRAVVREMFGEKSAGAVRILYGGSVNSETAGGYLDLEEVNGLLVGGASLNSHDFNSIVELANG